VQNLSGTAKLKFGRGEGEADEAKEKAFLRNEPTPRFGWAADLKKRTQGRGGLAAEKTNPMVERGSGD
jgi:hypothetical protein